MVYIYVCVYDVYYTHIFSNYIYLLYSITGNKLYVLLTAGDLYFVYMQYI